MTTTPGTAVNARAHRLDQHARKLRDPEYADLWREAGCPPPDSEWWAKHYGTAHLRGLRWRGEP